MFTYVEEKDLCIYSTLHFSNSNIISELISSESINSHIKIITLVLGHTIKFNVCFSVSVQDDKISLVNI